MKKIQKYIGAAVLGTVVMAFPGCSDTFDEHYSPGEGTSATKSLWELISEDANLSRFKEIAENATYYRDETHPQENYTFKDMLQGSMLVTAWVPTNDAFTDAEFQQWLELAKTNGYTVQQQLMANSIALWRQVATGGGVDTLTMLNGKKLVFDKDKFTMQGLPLEQKNIAATNGTLHVVQSALPFKYNLYEYLKDEDNASSNSLNLFHDLLVKNDTTYFNEGSSVEGNPDINGNPTYVDSVYTTTNTMFFNTHRFPTTNNTEKYLTYDESFGANIVAEDSTYILLMPNDNAWENAHQKLEKYYNYASKYIDKDKSAGQTQVSKMVFLNITDTDSLKEKNIAMDIASPLCYNLHMQPNSGGMIGRWQLDKFMAEKGQSATYFLNTFGDTLRSDDNWNKSALLEGTPVEVSNGIGIIKDEWDFPLKLYKPDLYIEVGSAFYNYSETDGIVRGISFSNDAAGEWVDTLGRVGENNFYYLYPKSDSGKPSAEFKLVGTHGENRESEVMSGKYDIGVVLVPNFYIYSGRDITHYMNTGRSTVDLHATAYVVDGDTIPVKHKIQGKLSYNNKKSNGTDETKTSATLEYSGEKVDTLWLFEDFEFPVSYKNLRQSFPTLQITANAGSTDRKIANGYTNAICIDRIILRSKED